MEFSQPGVRNHGRVRERSSGKQGANNFSSSNEKKQDQHKEVIPEKGGINFENYF